MDEEREKQEKEREERESIFNKKRLALLGLEEEESMSSLHKKNSGDLKNSQKVLETLNYPGRKIDD